MMGKEYVHFRPTSLYHLDNSKGIILMFALSTQPFLLDQHTEKKVKFNFPPERHASRFPHGWEGVPVTYKPLA